MHGFRLWNNHKFYTRHLNGTGNDYNSSLYGLGLKTVLKLPTELSQITIHNKLLAIFCLLSQNFTLFIVLDLNATYNFFQKETISYQAILLTNIIENVLLKWKEDLLSALFQFLQGKIKSQLSLV